MGVYLPMSTERLILREFELTDLESMHQYLSDPMVLKYMMQNTTNEEQSKEYVNRFLKFQQDEPRNFVRFAILLKSNGSLIGECGINMPNIDHREGEIVYRFHKDYWGHGYACEAAYKVIDFGFNEIGLHRIEAMCDSRNMVSARVLEKVGMKKEGCLREHQYVKGHWRSSLLFSILENEFHCTI